MHQRSGNTIGAVILWLRLGCEADGIFVRNPGGLKSRTLLEVMQERVPVPAWVSQFFDGVKLILGRPEDAVEVEL